MHTGMIVAKYRNAMGLTQEELAAKVNVSRNAIARLETEPKILSFEIMAKIADVLGCSLDELRNAGQKGGS